MHIKYSLWLIIFKCYFSAIWLYQLIWKEKKVMKKSRQNSKFPKKSLKFPNSLESDKFFSIGYDPYDRYPHLHVRNPRCSQLLYLIYTNLQDAKDHPIPPNPTIPPSPHPPLLRRQWWPRFRLRKPKSVSKASPSSEEVRTPKGYTGSKEAGWPANDTRSALPTITVLPSSVAVGQTDVW